MKSGATKGKPGFTTGFDIPGTPGTVKIPAEYLIAQLEIQSDIEEILKDNYKNILTMPDGKSDPIYFTDKQRTAYASLLSDYNNENHPANQILKEGIKKLEDIISGKEKKNNLNVGGKLFSDTTLKPKVQLNTLKSKLSKEVPFFRNMNHETTTSTHFARRLLTSINNDLFKRKEGSAPISVGKNMNLLYGEGTFNPIDALFDSDITNYIEDKLELRGLLSDALNEDLITDTVIIAEIQDILKILMDDIRKMQVLEENKGGQ